MFLVERIRIRGSIRLLICALLNLTCNYYEKGKVSCIFCFPILIMIHSIVMMMGWYLYVYVYVCIYVYVCMYVYVCVSMPLSICTPSQDNLLIFTVSRRYKERENMSHYPV